MHPEVRDKLDEMLYAQIHPRVIASRLGIHIAAVYRRRRRLMSYYHVSRRDEIEKMYLSGFDPETIAAKTGRSIAWVKYVCGMLNQPTNNYGAKKLGESIRFNGEEYKIISTSPFILAKRKNRYIILRND